MSFHAAAIALVQSLLVVHAGSTYQTSFFEVQRSSSMADFRHLLDEGPSFQISNHPIHQVLQAGEIYSICTIPESFAASSCVKYDYTTDSSLLSFVADKALCQDATFRGVVDTDFFAPHLIEEGTICTEHKCSGKISLGTSKDWCLMFFNSAVPSLNYTMTEEHLATINLSIQNSLPDGLVIIKIILDITMILFGIAAAALCIKRGASLRSLDTQDHNKLDSASLKASSP